MPIMEPPIEVGSATAPGGSATLALAVTSAIPAGALLHLRCIFGASGNPPTGATDAAGNTYAVSNTGLTPTGSKVSTLYSVITSPLSIGALVSPAWADAHGLAITGSMVTSGVSGFQQSVVAIGNGVNPYVSTAQFTQDNNHIFLTVVENNGQADTGYLDDDNITPLGLIYPGGGDAVHWGWCVPVGRQPQNFNPSFGTPTKWAIIADVFSAIDANFPRRIQVGEYHSPAPTPFVPDDMALPHRLRRVGKLLLDGRTGEPWYPLGYNLGAGVSLFPDMGPILNPLNLNDAQQSADAGSKVSRLQILWQNNSNPVTNFAGWIAGTTLTVTTAPVNAVDSSPAVIGGSGNSVPLIGQGAVVVLTGTKVVAPISINDDGTGTYTVSVSQALGSSGSPVLLTSSPLYPPESGRDAYNPTPYTDPVTGLTALVDPGHLSNLDAAFAATVADGRTWIVLHCSGGNENFWIDGVSIGDFCDLWKLLVARYDHYDKIAMWEPLAEPHPTNDPFNQDIAAAMYAQVIEEIRTIDTRTITLVGPVKTYFVANMGIFWQALVPLLDQWMLDLCAMTFNWYNLSTYVKVDKKSDTSTGYPSDPANLIPPINTANPAFPLYKDTKGDGPDQNVGYSYAGKGQLVVFNADWQENMFSCCVNFRETFGVPVWCNQLGGVRTDTPGGLQWMTDILTIAVKYQVGGAIWQWRNPWTSGGEPDNGDLCMVGQAVQNGPWLRKDGTNPSGTGLMDDWIGAIQGFLDPPPPFAFPTPPVGVYVGRSSAAVLAPEGGVDL